MKIAVAGTGYVGLSLATLLSQHHQVTAVDVVAEKVELINNRKSPIQDEYIERYLAEKPLQLKATTNAAEAYKDADFVIIATPTNYDPVKNYFDTTHVEEVVEHVEVPAIEPVQEVKVEEVKEPVTEVIPEVVEETVVEPKIKGKSRKRKTKKVATPEEMPQEEAKPVEEVAQKVEETAPIEEPAEVEEPKKRTRRPNRGSSKARKSKKTEEVSEE